MGKNNVPYSPSPERKHRVRRPVVPYTELQIRLAERQVLKARRPDPTPPVADTVVEFTPSIVTVDFQREEGRLTSVLVRLGKLVW